MSEESRARTAVARLELISHAPTRNYNGDGRGGEGLRLPTGGLRDGGVSFVKYRAELSRCVSESDFRRIADEVESALGAWTVTPRPPRDSEPWQEKAARWPGSITEAAKEWQVSKAYMHQLRARYGKAA